MSRNAEITLDWADGEYAFRLGIGELRELQEKTGEGPKVTVNRLMGGTWKVDDLIQTIRLGLIGGGTSAADALRLTRFYVEDKPLESNVPTAYAILMAALVGTDQENIPEGETEPAEDAETMTHEDSSPLPVSTDQEPS